MLVAPVPSASVNFWHSYTLECPRAYATSELLQMLASPPITDICIFKVLLWLVSIFD
jgi:hypothetical protein